MTIPNHYEINVAKRYRVRQNLKGEMIPMYRFYFRISEIDGLEEDALMLLKEIKEKYPSPEYDVTLHYVSCSSREIKMEGGES